MQTCFRAIIYLLIYIIYFKLWQYFQQLNILLPNLLFWSI